MTLWRLRLVFLALAVALALPGALLVRRALASVGLERDARNAAVAARAFDEMERALSELLRAEEERPASDYDFASPTSPLRERPAAGIALGYFQIDAAGRVSTPEWAARVIPLAEAVSGNGARLESVRRERARSAPAAGAPDRAKPQPDEREAPRVAAPPVAPMDVPPIGRAEPSATADPAPSPPDAAGEPLPTPNVEPDAKSEADASAYDALAKLNTGAKEREQRRQRVYVAEQAQAAEPGAAGAESSSSSAPVSPERYASPESDARASAARLVAEALASSAEAPTPAPEDHAPGDPARAQGKWTYERSAGGVAASEARRDATAPTPTPEPSETPERRAQAVAEEAAPPVRDPVAPRAEVAVAETVRPAPSAPLAAHAGASEPGAELVRVVVDPLQGRLAPSGELLLVRAAWIGAEGVRQGLALDPAQVERWLAAQALAQGALPGGALRLAPRTSLGASASLPERLVFAHRFGEPFETLGAELSFAPFTEPGAGNVAWLAALFALAASAGLFAVYRMSALALHFAQRRSNFAAAVSHELKTPLTAIRMYAEMLRDGLVASDAKRAEYYGSITSESERLSRLIDNVLEFSRLERGTRTLELRVGDAAPVVREAALLLRAHARAHGLELVLDVAGDLPPVRFERDALLQVLFNLIDNAVKYGRGEPARIEIACRRAGDGVLLSVRDHGPGVPRAELARILEPFYRRGDELTRSAPGAGIGLALVKALAEQMGAALEVTNPDGGGLAVTLQLSAAP